MVLKEYPYFQSVRAILLSMAKDQDSLQHKEALSQLAAHTSQREVLYRFLHKKGFQQHETAKKLRNNEHLVHHLEVIDPHFVEPKKEHPAQEWEKELPDKILDKELFVEKPAPGIKEESAPTDQVENLRLSFEGWIKYTVQKQLPIASPDPEPNLSEQKRRHPALERQKKFELIDKFIHANPRIENPQKSAPISTVSLSKPAEKEIMTETLAKLYWEQNKHKKAIKAYKILCLKYPEKSGYFADQIRAIELEMKQ